MHDIFITDIKSIIWGIVMYYLLQFRRLFLLLVLLLLPLQMSIGSEKSYFTDVLKLVPKTVNINFAQENSEGVFIGGDSPNKEVLGKFVKRLKNDKVGYSVTQTGTFNNFNLKIIKLSENAPVHNKSKDPLSSYSGVDTASFPCDKAKTVLEKSICSNKSLGLADKRMSDYYFKLISTLGENEKSGLKKDQRKWLESRARLCGSSDTNCLLKLYNERIHFLRKDYENLTPYRLSGDVRLNELSSTCGFDEVEFPDDFFVLASGAYKGVVQNNQIDQSGHRATRFEIVVNSTDKPAVLILGAYEPSIWNISWTKGTHILAVLVTGYHRQVLAGLPADTPVLNSSYDNRGPCKYLYMAEKNLHKLNPLSEKVFNKKVNKVVFAKSGYAVLGRKLSRNSNLFTSKDTPPEKFIDGSKPRAGKDGIRDAISKGVLRPVTRADLHNWAKQKAAISKSDDLPPVENGNPLKAYMPRRSHNGYVILKKFTIPAGLYGAHSATFFLDEGVPYPEGKLGHSVLYDFNTMSCRGPACGVR